MTPRTEILALTGLRFVAAAAVVLHHLRAPDDAPRIIKSIIDRGWVGVPLFFMLSGLVLAWNYPTLSPRQGRGVARFLIARFARVMPLYWLMLAYLMVLRFSQGNNLSPWKWHALTLQTWHPDVGVAYAYNAPGWSIGVEVFLYACFPFLVPLVAAVARRGIRPLVLLAALAWAVQIGLVLWFRAKGWAFLPPSDGSSAHRWLYRNPLCRLPDFVVGMCMAFVLLRGFRIRAAYATALHVLIAGYVLVFAAIPTTDKAFAGWYFSAVWTVPFAVLLITLAGSDRAPLSRLLSTRAMLTLGTASYALYLTHRPILAGLGDRLTGPSSGGREWLLIGTVFVFTLFVAEGAHRYVEVPARRFIVDLSHRFLGRPPARTPPAPAADEAVRTPGAAELHDTIRTG